MTDIDAALKQVLHLRARLGILQGAGEGNPWGGLAPEAVLGAPAHLNTARDAVAKGVWCGGRLWV